MIIRFDDLARNASEEVDSFAFVHETVSSAEIVHVLGSVDLSNADALEKAIADVVPLGRPLVVDVRDCSYIGAAGYAALVRAHKRLGGRIAIAVKAGGVPALLFSLFADRGPFRTEQSIERAICAAVLRRAQPEGF